jgi:TolA-binding protein
MSPARIAAALLAAATLPTSLFAQTTPPVRRAQPAEEPPVARAVPFEPAPTATPQVRRALPAAPEELVTPPPPPKPTAAAAASTDHPEPAEPGSNESPEQRQLNYANALFGRKLYDLAAPEYEKFIGLYPGSAQRASVYFYLGECYRALNRGPAARTSFQTVVDQFPESEFAGPAAYGIAEILFTQKDYGGALTLFHRAAAKTKASALALSARYFEARCLENVDRKDEAGDIYQQVVGVKDPNPYRDDARLALGSILLGRGRKSDALKQFETLANETQKAALKAEATVRAGMVALDLQQVERAKPDKAMMEKAMALLLKGRGLPEAGRWRGVAQVGLLRLQYQSGQFSQVVGDYNKAKDQIPEEVRPEILLLVANSERQLGHNKEAEELYREIMQKYPGRDEAKDAQYQRLISLYNSNSPTLQNELEEFLKANPNGERTDQAKLLKAEALYKQQKYAEAAPLYSALRSSQLSAKLRVESAYKLGWCHVQLKQPPNTIDAFSYFLKAFPDAAEVPSALAQRALAYQESKNYESALADLNTLLAKYPKAREREAALQQKALILGQQDNSRGMSETFQQLLKEYPKTSVAAQANYYIGKAAFEAKDYRLAIPALDTARQLNKDQYYTVATLRIISSYFYLKDREALTNEVNSFTAAAPTARVPAEVIEWLGIEYYNDKSYPAAAKYLSALGQRDDLANVRPEFWFYLGDTQLRLNNSAESEAAFERYLQTASDPAARAKALLALGAAKIAVHKADDAQKIADEIMSLQPEGRVNAEARLLAGDVQIERQRFEEAGKAYMGVALLYDDPAITPRALDKAAQAYQKAGKNDEAARVIQQLRQKYPNYVGG